MEENRALTAEEVRAIITTLHIKDAEKLEVLELVKAGKISEAADKTLAHVSSEIEEIGKEAARQKANFDHELKEHEGNLQKVVQIEEEEFDRQYQAAYGRSDEEDDRLSELEKVIDQKSDEAVKSIRDSIGAPTVADQSPRGPEVTRVTPEE